ncbi:MAG: ABC-2 family transporter protein [candidate division WOR-3 bacterium]
MRAWARRLRYYVSLWGEFLLLQVKRETIFRGSFLLEIVSYALWFLFNIFFFGVIFSHVKSIGGWGPLEVLTLISVNQVISAFYDGVLGTNLRRFQTYIERGDFDLFLMKPLDLQFFVSTRFADLKPLFSIPFPVFTLLFALLRRRVNIGVFDIFLFILCFVIGVLIRYGLGFLVMSLSFYFVRISALHSLQRELLSYAGYPLSIYEGFSRILFTFIFPVALIANLPAQAILNYQVSYGLLIYSLIFGLFILVFSRKMFYHALKHYESASS